MASQMCVQCVSLSHVFTSVCLQSQQSLLWAPLLWRITSFQTPTIPRHFVCCWLENEFQRAQGGVAVEEGGGVGRCWGQRWEVRQLVNLFKSSFFFFTPQIPSQQGTASYSHPSLPDLTLCIGGFGTLYVCVWVTLILCVHEKCHIFRRLQNTKANLFCWYSKRQHPSSDRVGGGYRVCLFFCLQYPRWF